MVTHGYSLRIFCQRRGSTPHRDSENSELKNFYDLYPERFNNKTNGITFRRWLMHCNPMLTRYIESLIGNGFKKDATELEKLLAFENDETVLNKLEEIKMERNWNSKNTWKKPRD